MDPFKLAADDLEGMTARIKEMLGVDHPVLSTVAKCVLPPLQRVATSRACAA